MSAPVPVPVLLLSGLGTSAYLYTTLCPVRLPFLFFLTPFLTPHVNLFLSLPDPRSTFFVTFHFIPYSIHTNKDPLLLFPPPPLARPTDCLTNSRNNGLLKTTATHSPSSSFRKAHPSSLFLNYPPPQEKVRVYYNCCCCTNNGNNYYHCNADYSKHGYPYKCSS